MSGNWDQGWGDGGGQQDQWWDKGGWQQQQRQQQQQQPGQAPQMGQPPQVQMGQPQQQMGRPQQQMGQPQQQMGYPQYMMPQQQQGMYQGQWGAPPMAFVPPPPPPPPAPEAPPAEKAAPSNESKEGQHHDEDKEEVKEKGPRIKRIRKWLTGKDATAGRIRYCEWCRKVYVCEDLMHAKKCHEEEIEALRRWQVITNLQSNRSHSEAGPLSPAWCDLIRRAETSRENAADIEKKIATHDVLSQLLPKGLHAQPVGSTPMGFSVKGSNLDLYVSSTGFADSRVFEGGKMLKYIHEHLKKAVYPEEAVTLPPRETGRRVVLNGRGMDTRKPGMVKFHSEELAKAWVPRLKEKYKFIQVNSVEVVFDGFKPALEAVIEMKNAAEDQELTDPPAALYIADKLAEHEVTLCVEAHVDTMTFMKETMLTANQPNIVLLFCVVVRNWARLKNVIDEEHGTFSSFCFNLVIVFFLQRSGVCKLTDPLEYTGPRADLTNVARFEVVQDLEMFAVRDMILAFLKFVVGYQWNKLALCFDPTIETIQKNETSFTASNNRIHFVDPTRYNKFSYVIILDPYEDFNHGGNLTLPRVGFANAMFGMTHYLLTHSVPSMRPYAERWNYAFKQPVDITKSSCPSVWRFFPSHVTANSQPSGSSVKDTDVFYDIYFYCSDFIDVVQECCLPENLAATQELNPVAFYRALIALRTHISDQCPEGATINVLDLCARAFRFLPMWKMRYMKLKTLKKTFNTFHYLQLKRTISSIVFAYGMSPRDFYKFTELLDTPRDKWDDTWEPLLERLQYFKDRQWAFSKDSTAMTDMAKIYLGQKAPWKKYIGTHDRELDLLMLSVMYDYCRRLKYGEDYNKEAWEDEKLDPRITEAIKQRILTEVPLSTRVQFMMAAHGKGEEGNSGYSPSLHRLQWEKAKEIATTIFTGGMWDDIWKGDSFDLAPVMREIQNKVIVVAADFDNPSYLTEPPHFPQCAKQGIWMELLYLYDVISTIGTPAQPEGGYDIIVQIFEEAKPGLNDLWNARFQELIAAPETAATYLPQIKPVLAKIDESMYVFPPPADKPATEHLAAMLCKTIPRHTELLRSDVTGLGKHWLSLSRAFGTLGKQDRRLYRGKPSSKSRTAIWMSFLGTFTVLKPQSDWAALFPKDGKMPYPCPFIVRALEAVTWVESVLCDMISENTPPHADSEHQEVNTLLSALPSNALKLLDIAESLPLWTAFYNFLTTDPRNAFSLGRTLLPSEPWASLWTRDALSAPVVELLRIFVLHAVVDFADSRLESIQNRQLVNDPDMQFKLDQDPEMTADKPVQHKHEEGDDDEKDKGYKEKFEEELKKANDLDTTAVQVERPRKRVREEDWDAERETGKKGKGRRYDDKDRDRRRRGDDRDRKRYRDDSPGDRDRDRVRRSDRYRDRGDSSDYDRDRRRRRDRDRDHSCDREEGRRGKGKGKGKGKKGKKGGKKGKGRKDHDSGDDRNDDKVLI